MADAITAGLSIDAVRSELTPDQKVLVVLSERKNGPVMMVGDGVNDAPALAAADLGLAMGARGAAASAEAADVVLLVDQLDRVVPAIQIARRSRFIALESVYAGISLSVIGMIAAAFGYITPVQGALLQELIDVTVILNALRVLKDRIRSVNSRRFGATRSSGFRLLATQHASLMSASLIGHSGSSAFRLSTTTVSMSLTGSCFSSESAPRPLYGAFFVKEFARAAHLFPSSVS